MKLCGRDPNVLGSSEEYKQADGSSQVLKKALHVLKDKRPGEQGASAAYSTWVFLTPLRRQHEGMSANDVH